MVKHIHNIIVTAFIRKDEERFTRDELEASLAWFVPEEIAEEDFAKEGITLEQETIKIEDGVNLEKFIVTVSKDKHDNWLLAQLKEVLGEDQCQLLLEQENRLDEQCNFFMRLDKQAWVRDGIAKLVDHGDCIHIKMTIAAFPKNRQSAKAVVEKLFSEE